MGGESAFRVSELTGLDPPLLSIPDPHGFALALGLSDATPLPPCAGVLVPARLWRVAVEPSGLLAQGARPGPFLSPGAPHVKRLGVRVIPL